MGAANEGVPHGGCNWHMNACIWLASDKRVSGSLLASAGGGRQPIRRLRFWFWIMSGGGGGRGDENYWLTLGVFHSVTHWFIWQIDSDINQYVKIEASVCVLPGWCAGVSRSHGTLTSNYCADLRDTGTARFPAWPSIVCRLFQCVCERERDPHFHSNSLFLSATPPFPVPFET